MSAALTQYGVKDLKIALEAFSELGKKILSGDITKKIKAVNKKDLRYFKTKEAAEMIGRSDTFLRKLELTDPSFEPKRINGIRYYTLELINRIRDKAGTRLKRPKGSKPLIFSVANFKGGVGKSTISKNLADKMALAGLRVLIVGVEAQATDGLYYGIIPELDIKPEETIRNALLEDPSITKSLIHKTYFDGIDIIPGNLTLTDVAIKLTDYKEQINLIKKLGMPDERLQKALSHIEDDYDIIFLDCGANLNIVTLNAIQACNCMLIPLPPDSVDFASFVTFSQTLSKHLSSDLKEKRLDFLRIVISKKQNNSTSHEMADTIREQYAGYMLLRDLVFSAEITKASKDFCSIYELSPNSKATYKRAFDSLESVFNEILEAATMIWDAQTKKEGNNDEQ